MPSFPQIREHLLEPQASWNTPETPLYPQCKISHLVENYCIHVRGLWFLHHLISRHTLASIWRPHEGTNLNFQAVTAHRENQPWGFLCSFDCFVSYSTFRKARVFSGFRIASALTFCTIDSYILCFLVDYLEEVIREPFPLQSKNVFFLCWIVLIESFSIWEVELSRKMVIKCVVLSLGFTVNL